MTAPSIPDLHTLAAQTRPLRRLARSILRNAADADDAVQETWRRALVKAEAGQRISAGWLRGAVRNVARETRRGDARRQKRHDAASRPGVHPDTAEDVQRLEAHRLLAGALTRLEEPFRTALLWRYLRGMSAAAIGRALQVPAPTVRWRLQEGIRRLRVDLESSDEGRGRPQALIGSLAGTSSAATWGGGALAMAQGLRWGAGGTLLLVLGILALGVGTWFLARGVSGTPETTPMPPDAPPLAGDEAPGLAVPEGATDEVPPVALEDVTPSRPYTLVGRVVAADRSPVADADVRFHAPGIATAHGRTDAEGRYRIVVPRDDLGAFTLATVDAVQGHRQGSVNVRCDALATSRAPVEPIVLEEGARLLLRVHAGGTLVEGAQVVVSRRAHYIAWEARAVLHEGRTDALGQVRLPRAVAGRIQVHAWKPDAGMAFRAMTVAPDASAVELALAPGRQVQVTVVDHATGTPLPGVAVGAAHNPAGTVRGVLPLRPPILTDAQGRATLTDLPRGTALWVRPEKAGWHGPVARQGEPYTHLIPESGGAITLALATHHTLRIPIEGESPPEGATLQVHAQDAAPDLRAVVRDRHVVLEGVAPDPHFGVDPTFVGTVVAPSGALAEIAWMPGHPQDEVVFQDDRRIRIHLLQADGTPAAHRDLTVGPRMQHLPALRTDGEGLVEAWGLEGEDAHIFLPGPERGVLGMGDRVFVAKVPLPALTDPVVVRLPPEGTVTLAVTIDGVPGLPARYRVVESGRLVHWESIEEDPLNGLLHVRRVLPTEAPPMPTAASGPRWFQVLGEDVVGDRVAWRPGEEDRLDVPLERGGVLAVQIDPPEAAGRVRLGLQRFDASRGTWRRAPRAPEMHSNAADGSVWGDDGVVHFVRLYPGRYRVVDHRCLRTSTDAEVASGGSPARCVLDLTGITSVRGRVVFPAGWHNEGHLQIHVSVDGKARKPNWNVFDYRLPRNAFQAHVPRGSVIRIRATHKGLTSRESEGVVVTAGEDDEVVLHLDEPEGLWTFDLAPPDEQAPPAFVRAQRMDEAGTAAPVERLPRQGGRYAVVADGASTRFRLVVDPGAPWMPLAMEDLRPGRGTRDLGTRTLKRGHVLRVRVEVPPGKQRPMIRLRATGTWRGMVFTRDAWVQAGGTGDLRLEGLPPGRVELRVGPGRYPRDVMLTGPAARTPPPEIVRDVEVGPGEETVVTVALEDAE